MNIKKYYLYSFFEDLIPIYPLYLLMFESKGLTITEISWLLSIWSLTTVLFELPTGVFADRWNRKNLIVLGCFLKALCYLIWMFSEGFILYAIGFFFWGIGGTLRSGSEEALLYDSLKVMGREKEFEQVLGKGHFLSGISNMLACITGGLLGMKYGFQTALGLSVGSGVLTAGIAFTMKEVNLYKEKHSKCECCMSKGKQGKLKGKQSTLINAILFIYRSKDILMFSLIAFLVITTAGILDEYDQLIAKEYGLTIKMIGIWSAIRFILISLGCYIASSLKVVVEKLFHIKDRMYTLSFLCVTAGLFLITAGYLKHLSVMGLYGLYYLIMAACGIIQEDYVQQNIDQEGRSTVHSLISLLQNLYGIIFFVIFGAGVSQSGLHAGLIGCGVYIVYLTLLIGFIYRFIKNKYIKKDG